MFLNYIKRLSYDHASVFVELLTIIASNENPLIKKY